MKYATVENVVASFPHPILPIFQIEPYYHSIHSVRKLLQEIHAPLIPIYEGGVLGHIVTIVSPVAYAVVAPTTPCINPKSSGRAPATIDNGNVAQIGAERNRWEEATATLKAYNTLKRALKKTDHNSILTNVLGNFEQLNSRFC